MYARKGESYISLRNVLTSTKDLQRKSPHRASICYSNTDYAVRLQVSVCIVKSRPKKNIDSRSRFSGALEIQNMIDISFRLSRTVRS